MYYWVIGYPSGSSGGQSSIAGPYRDRDTADAETQGWMQKNIVDLNTPDRNQAIAAINAKRSQSPPASKPVKVRDVTEEEDDSDDDASFEDDEDFDEA